jgi:hypothetical protein
MKTFIAALALSVLSLIPTSAFCWTCATPGQVRVQVPAGTLGNGTGDGNGQVVVDNGLTFICEAIPTVAPQNQSQLQNQTQNQTQTQVQNQSTTSTANSTSSATSANTNSNSATGGNNSNNTTTNVQAPIIPVQTAYAPTASIGGVSRHCWRIWLC